MAPRQKQSGQGQLLDDPCPLLFCVCLCATWLPEQRFCASPCGFANGAAWLLDDAPCAPLRAAHRRSTSGPCRRSDREKIHVDTHQKRTEFAENRPLHGTTARNWSVSVNLCDNRHVERIHCGDPGLGVATFEPFSLVAITEIVPGNLPSGQQPRHAGLLRLARFRALADTHGQV